MSDQVVEPTDEQTPEHKEIATWRRNLVIGGALMLLVTALLQWWKSSTDSVVTAVTKDSTVTTTTAGSGPPDALIATALGAAILLLLVAAFFSRVEKISAFGIELTLTKAEERAVVEKTVEEAAVQGLDESEVPAAVAKALENAKGTKAMLRNGVTPARARADLVLDTNVILDPDMLANYSAVSAVRSLR